MRDLTDKEKGWVRSGLAELARQKSVDALDAAKAVGNWKNEDTARLAAESEEIAALVEEFT
jgi:hypothetical protein